MRYDAIVIGGGLSGLAAAVRLSHFGWTVRVFERHALPGGLNAYYFRHGAPMNVGLHAVTNYAEPDKALRTPLHRVFRQLRLRLEDLALQGQNHSLIRIPGHVCRFTNDPAVLEAEIAREFPAEADAFRAFAQRVSACDLYRDGPLPYETARQALRDFISDPALADMLLMPVMFYGNPRPDDMDFRLFALIFRALFLEGIAYPRDGIRPCIRLLTERLRANGGELSLGNGVRRILCDRGRAVAVEDDRGDRHEAGVILSSAGAAETAGLCPEAPRLSRTPAGDISFVETIFRLNRLPRDLGLTASIIFSSTSAPFVFRPPAGPVDFGSALLCMPGNYRDCADIPDAMLVRVSHLADPAWWLNAAEQDYRREKAAVCQRQRERLEREWPGFSAAVLEAETMTPRTVRQYTGKANGAIYGSPEKLLDGETGLGGLRLIGTDQGLMGIVGAMVGGVAMANKCMENGLSHL